MTITTNEESVARFYDQLDAFLEIFFGNKENLHVGYWRDSDDNRSVTEAQELLTDIMIDKVALHPGQEFLDVGCGRGWPAIRLARAKSCQVTGITVSPVQVGRANERAQCEGADQYARFVLANALNMPFPASSFDGAWAFESMLHMDRPRVLQEISRVLKPNGRLVIADLVETTPLTPEQKDLLIQTYQVSTILSIDEYERLLRDAGFKLEETIDITPNTKRTWDAGVLPKIRQQLEDIYPPEVIARMYERFPKGHHAISATGYCIFVATR